MQLQTNSKVPADSMDGQSPQRQQQGSQHVAGKTSIERPQAPGLPRGSTLERAGTNLTMMRAGTLSVEENQMRDAVQNLHVFDTEADRPFCCGLWKLQQMIGCCIGLFLIVIVCLVQPIPTQYSKANEMLGITLLCGAFWVFEVVPIYITALIPVCLMPLMQITSSAIAAQAYWNPVQMLVIGTYLVDIALEEVSLPRRVALGGLLAIGIKQPGLVLFAFMFASFVLSIFCNNIAVTLMITPFAIGLLNAASERELDQAAELESSVGTEEQVGAQTKSRNEVEQFSKGVLIGIAYGATTGGMASLIGSIPNELLLGLDHVASLIGFGDFIQFAFPVSAVTFLVAFGSVYFRYVSGLKRGIITRDLLQAEYEELVGEIGQFGRDEAAVGCIQALQFLLLLCKPFLAKFMVTPYGAELLSDPTLACIPAAMLFFIPSKTNPGNAVLSWTAVHEKFDFGLLLLIGGGFAIASGFSQSGLDVALGDGLASILQKSGDRWITFVVMFVCAIATQVFSAIGTATTVLPSLTSAALNAVRNPLGMILPATIACSLAFSLPTATPANVVVLAKSRMVAELRVRDFLWSGLPVNLIMMFVAPFVVYGMASMIFNAYEPFPHWACNGVNCIWANVPGNVHGFQVQQQACVLDVDPNMTFCKIANGTILPFEQVYAPLGMPGM